MAVAELSRRIRGYRAPQEMDAVTDAAPAEMLTQ